MTKDRLTELAEIWLNRAQDDIKWANDSFEDKHFSGVCFLCQQAVEKALKAYLFSQKQKLIRTHNLERLLERCLKFDKQFLSIKQNCQIPNDYYIDTRYPDIWDRARFGNKNLASEALKLANKVVNFINRHTFLKAL